MIDEEADGKVPSRAVGLPKAGLTKKRYKTNPFVSEGGFSIPTRNKRETLQTMGPASVVVDGQQIDVAQVVRVRQVDTDRFVKVFVNHLAGFYDLTPTSMRLLTVLLHVVSDARFRDTDQIVLTEAIARETMKEQGQKPLSSASYYRAINELIASGFIAPTETPPLFFINPAVLFNGDRVRFVTELRRERASAADRERKALEEAGQKSLPLP